MNTKKFKIDMLEDENIVTYLVTSEDLTLLEEEIKEYSKEDVATFHERGPYLTTRAYVHRKILRFYDEILDIEYETESIRPGIYTSPVDMTVTAQVRNYPILWHIFFDDLFDKYFKGLKDYLNNNGYLSASIGKKPKYLSEFYRALKKEDAEKVKYDSNIPEKEKLKMINNFLSSLTFQQIKVESISDINKQIENTKSIMETEKTNELIKSIKILEEKIRLAKENTESINFINNKLNSEKILIRK